MQQETARPTPVDRNVYIKFGNKCRTNRREVSEVITDLMNLYLKDGERVFE